MKWLIRGVLGLAGLLVAGVGILAFLNTRPGADEMEARVEINKPPEVVWGYITDPKRHKEWVDWLAWISTRLPSPKPEAG